jgi:hypothetical protein
VGAAKAWNIRLWAKMKGRGLVQPGELWDGLIITSQFSVDSYIFDEVILLLDPKLYDRNSSYLSFIFSTVSLGKL